MAAKETGGAGAKVTRKAAKTASVLPVDGWSVQSPYGVLKTCNGLVLVRLEDVHAWMMQRDAIPSASAAARVFGVFVSDASSELGMAHGAAKLRNQLYITDLSGYADGLGGWAGRSYLEKVAEQMPYVPHHRFDRGTPEAIFYALGLLAGEVWAPQCRSVGLDDRMEGYSAEGYFPSLEKSREILGHFAVSTGLAHLLWNWGTVSTGEVVQLHAVPDESAEPKNWDDLVSWRKAHPGYEWLLTHKKIVFFERERRRPQRGVAKAMAEELNVTEKYINDLIRQSGEKKELAKKYGA